MRDSHPLIVDAIRHAVLAARRSHEGIEFLADLHRQAGHRAIMTTPAMRAVQERQRGEG